MAVLGQITVNEIMIFEVDVPPNVAPGVEAPEGSLAIVTDGSGVYLKNGPGNTDWVKVSVVLPISANDVTVINDANDHLGGADNAQDAFDYLAYAKANLHGGNNFTGNQSIAHPNNSAAAVKVWPGYFPGNNGALITIPSNNGPFIMGYIDANNAIAPVLGRAVNNNEVVSGSLANDNMVLSQSRVLVGNTQNNMFTQFHSNGVGVGFLTNDQPASAILEMRSGSQGFLMPRLTETQINTITNPAQYLALFNTTRNSITYHVNGVWYFEQYGAVLSTAANSTVNFVNIPHTAIAALPAGVYEVQGRFVYNSASSAVGIGIRLRNTTGAFNWMNIVWRFSTSTNGSTTMFWQRHQTSAADNYASTTSTATTNNLAEFNGIFSVQNNTTPVFQFRSSTAGSAVTVIRGYFRIKRIG